MQGSKNERLRSKSNTGGASREEVNKGYGGCKTRKIPWGPPKCEETRGQAKVMMQNNYFMEDLVKEETTIVGHISSIGFNATDDKELSAIKTVPAPL